MTNRINKTRLFSLLAFAAVVVIFLNACGKDNKVIQKEIPFTDTIKGIIVDGPWDVVVEFDSINNSVLLEYRESDKDKVSAKLLSNGYLHLKISSFGGNVNRKVFRAKVNASWLERIELSGAAQLKTYGYYDTYSMYPFEKIDISLSGASYLTLYGFIPRGVVANITLSGASSVYGLAVPGYAINVSLSGASNLDLWYYGYSMDAKISGASYMTLIDNSMVINHCAVDCSGASTFRYFGEEGYVRGCSYKGSGASHFEARDLEMDYLDIHLSGASNAEVTVNNTITGKLTGASLLKYRKATDVSGVSVDNSSEMIRIR